MNSKLYLCLFVLLLFFLGNINAQIPPMLSNFNLQGPNFERMNGFSNIDPSLMGRPPLLQNFGAPPMIPHVPPQNHIVSNSLQRKIFGK